MILSNQARCKLCDDTPFSRHRHDFQSCRCGEIAVDGGTEYIRRLAKDMSNLDDMSIVVPDEAGRAAIEKIEWALSTKRTPYGILCATAVGLRDAGVTLFSAEELARPVEPDSDEEFDLELLACSMANDKNAPAYIQKGVAKLWAAFVAREEQIKKLEGDRENG